MYDYDKYWLELDPKMEAHEARRAELAEVIQCVDNMPGENGLYYDTHRGHFSLASPHDASEAMSGHVYLITIEPARHIGWYHTGDPRKTMTAEELAEYVLNHLGEWLGDWMKRDAAARKDQMERKRLEALTELIETVTDKPEENGLYCNPATDQYILSAPFNTSDKLRGWVYVGTIKPANYVGTYYLADPRQIATAEGVARQVLANIKEGKAQGRWPTTFWIP